MQRVKQYLQSCARPRIVMPCLLTLLWVAMVLWVPDNFIRAAASALFLAVMPGYALYRAITGYARQPLALLGGYAVGLSLIFLMITGLAVNQILPLFGIAQPLTLPNLTVTIGGATFVAILAMALRPEPTADASLAPLLLRQWRAKTLGFWLLGLLLVLLPFAAIGGANTLDNGGTGWLALTAVGLSAVAVATLLWTKKNQLLGLYPLALYSLCATILLGTSMRGWNITGHDVMQEFQVFQLTSGHSLWNMQFYQDAYTACLSITILPTIFQKLTNIADPYIFKLVFQLLFALVAPLLYTALRSRVARKTAFLAVLVFVTFPTFLTDIMMLNRQEIALLCFALALSAALDKRLNGWRRHALLIIFMGGMVLSHYSTSYIAMSVLLVALGLGAGLKLLGLMFGRFRLPIVQRAHFSLFPPYLAGLVLVMIIGWNGLATHTAGNISQTLATIGTDVVRLISPGAVPQTTSVKPQANTVSGYIGTIAATRPLPANEYYPDSNSFQPTEIQPTTDPLTAPVQALHVPASAVTSFYSLSRQAYVAMLAGLLAIGLVLLALRPRIVRLANQYLLLGTASVIVVALQIVLPADAVNYGLTRVIQQNLIILSLPATLAALWLLGKLRLNYLWRFRLFGVGLAGFFLILSSFASTLTGGFKPVLAFSNSGFYYEAYYTHSDEISADQWLTRNAPHGSRVYSDEFARRKMITYAGIFPQPTLVPVGIPIDSYVYLSDGDTTFRNVPVYFNGNLLFYTPPTDFLNSHKNLLYNSGSVQIYK